MAAVRQAAGKAVVASPPRIPFLQSADKIRSHTSNIISTFKAEIDAIAAMPDDKVSLFTVAKAWGHAEGVAASASVAVTLPSFASGSGDTQEKKEVREASSQAKKELSNMWNALYERVDLNNVLQTLMKKEASFAGWSAEDIRFVQIQSTRLKRGGVHLSDAERTKLGQIRVRCAELCSNIEQNINQDTKKISFAPKELAGVPEAFIANAPTDDNKNILIGMKRPEYAPVLKFCSVESTRQRLTEALHQRCPENKDLFAELMHLRHKAAEYLGYKSHNHYILEPKMAKNPEEVYTFLNDLAESLKVKAQEERDALEALKRQHTGNTQAELMPWDMAFLENIQRKELFNIDDNKIKEYFPLDHVLKEIMSIYGSLLGVKFEKLDRPELVWDEDVSLYAVHDDSADGGVLGYFFLDLFPRPGKYGHQCVLPIQPCYLLPESEKLQAPAVALVGNFPRPEAGKPVLLRHDEVRTMFHEYGHVCHGVLTKADYSLFSWAWSAVPYPGGVENDFLEVPSMMFEQWIWKPEILMRLSSKYDNPSEKLPMETIQTLSKLRKHNRALHEVRYLAMALVDMKMHAEALPEKPEEGFPILAKHYTETLEEVALVKPVAGCHYVTSWYHMIHGYDAGYYGYGWSESMAMDCFATFEKTTEGCENTKLGRKVRDTILTPGATKSGSDMIKDFLEREPANTAFLQSLGITK
eukprot:m.73733 g.73733  ORF g.73733 m.73733 type:complete len:698 (-) comp12430_c0_seq7:2555-4648(-)